MSNINLTDLLPKNISNEAAYHLVNFMTDLALVIQGHYFSQLMHFTKEESALIQEIK